MNNEITTKKCSKCKVEKLLEDFSKHKNEKYGRHHYCRLCNSIQKKNTYNYTIAKNKFISNKYKINMEIVENMYLNQNKCCKICGVHKEKVTKFGGLYIDHCHKTGKVRGLLCVKCNTLIGVASDKISILNKAIEYLNMFN